MPTREVDVDECPIEPCDQDVTIALITTEPTKLAKQNLVHDRICLVPTMDDGEAATYIVYHTDADPTEPDHPEPADETDDDGADDADTSETDDAPGPDPGELDGHQRAAYKRLYEETATGGSALLADLQGKLMDDDLSPDDVKTAMAELVEGGYVEEVTDAAYKPRSGHP